jgi:enterochelin esterase-like enzyme
MKKIVLLFLITTFSFAQSKIESHQIIDKEKFEGIINRIDSFPTKLIVPRTVDVWLPFNYSKDKKYSVLYMHDGQMLFDASSTWNKQEWKVDDIVTKLNSENKIEDIIIVAIWNIPDIRFIPKQTLSITFKRK